MNALVLASGGLDSTAALVYAVQSYGRECTTGLFVYYGQPAADREIRSVIAACKALAVPFVRCDLQSVFHGSTTGLFIPRESAIVGGRDTAFLPGRNAMLLAAAATCGGIRWEPNPYSVLVGCNAHDAAGFPDCRLPFLTAAEDAFRAGGANLNVVAPWLTKTKRQIVDYVRAEAPEHLDLLRASWSCYRPDGPCGACTACMARVGAFEGDGADPLPDRGVKRGV